MLQHIQYAKLSTHAYRDKRNVPPPDGWNLIRYDDDIQRMGLSIAVYSHERSREYAVAFRGAVPTNIQNLRTDMDLLLQQLPNTFPAAKKWIDDFLNENRISGTLCLTGHSLGAALAELMALSDKQYHAITFDSPGIAQSAKTLIDSYDASAANQITGYLSAPNYINTCQNQIGRRYMVYVPYFDGLTACKIVHGVAASTTRIAKLVNASAATLRVGLPILNLVSNGSVNVASLNTVQELAKRTMEISLGVYRGTQLFNLGHWTLCQHSIENITKSFNLDTGRPFLHYEVLQWPKLNTLLQTSFHLDENLFNSHAPGAHTMLAHDQWLSHLLQQIPDFRIANSNVTDTSSATCVQSQNTQPRRRRRIKYDCFFSEAKVDERCWRVALLRKADKNHAFILAQGVDQTGKLILRRYDFVIQNPSSSSSGLLGFLPQQQAHIVVKDNQFDSFSSAKAAYHNDYLCGANTCGKNYAITARQAMKLHQMVLAQKNSPSPYQISGDRATVASSTSQTGHNCYSWARKILSDIDPTIRSDLKGSSSDFVAQVPSLVLH